MSHSNFVNGQNVLFLNDEDDKTIPTINNFTGGEHIRAGIILNDEAGQDMKGHENQPLRDGVIIVVCGLAPYPYKVSYAEVVSGHIVRLDASRTYRKNKTAIDNLTCGW